MRNAFVKTLCDLVARDKNIYLLTGDLGFGALDKFRADAPDNFINAGIAEQNMTAVAAGLALEGKTVFTYSVANFPTLRCLEQIRNCAAYHRANVKIVSAGVGMGYGSMGITHHATEDLSVMRAIPNVTIFSPADAAETVAVTKAAYETAGTCYIRLSKGSGKSVHDCAIADYKIGTALKIIDGDDIAILSTGAITSEAAKAAVALKNFGAALYSFATVKPIDGTLIETLAKKCKLIVTVEEGNIIGGLGSAVAEILSEMTGKVALLKRIGLRDEFPEAVGNRDYLCRRYRIASENICEVIKMITDELITNYNKNGRGDIPKSKYRYNRDR